MQLNINSDTQVEMGRRRLNICIWIWEVRTEASDVNLGFICKEMVLKATGACMYGEEEQAKN